MTKLARYLFGQYNALNIATRTLDEQRWYMLKDICRNVGIANPTQVLKCSRAGVLPNEYRKETIYIGGYGKKHVVLINEAAMLKVIMYSKSPQALVIQDRVKNCPDYLRPASWVGLL